MAKISPLFSSSSGNSTLITVAGQSILVDAGVSCKKLTTTLQHLDIDPKTLGGIFLTHEHIDHIKGLKVFTKQHAVPVYASTEVLEFLTSNDLVHHSSCLHSISDCKISLGSMELTAFKTPHDSVGSVGYNIHTQDGLKLAVATDIGEVTSIIKEKLSGCDMVVLESNYDEMMLKTGPYPYFLKQRISSNHGHLSNDCCAGLAGELIRTGTSKFILAHLSKENNQPTLAKLALSSQLEGMGFAAEKDFSVMVATPDFTGQVVYV